VTLAPWPEDPSPKSHVTSSLDVKVTWSGAAPVVGVA